MTLGYIKCPKCQETSSLYTPYPKCWTCEHEQKIEPNKLELEYRNKVEEMIKYLLPTGTPSLICPNVSISPRGNDCYGWSNGDTNIVSIPRNTFYMSREALANTTAHESAHVVPEVWKEHKEEGAGHEYESLWYKVNEEFQSKIKNQFNSWINQPNPNVKYLKNYYKNHPEYSLIKGDLLYDPYEDD
ncbi:MAG: hypothetical protein LBR43_00160 [Spiroplasmataceae bacterium]|jgi:hypothetical protein|nr:hypothetical protein [Spiroplasmataceae bacterium]